MPEESSTDIRLLHAHKSLGHCRSHARCFVTAFTKSECKGVLLITANTVNILGKGVYLGGGKAAELTVPPPS